MNRRQFFRVAFGLAAAVSAPGVQASDGVVLHSIAHPAPEDPRTVAELKRRADALFAGGARGMPPRAWEEFTYLGQVEGKAEHEEVAPRVYRVIPVTWAEEGETEAELVALAWADLTELALKHGDGTIVWRLPPEMRSDLDFESSTTKRRLVFRCGVLPANWELQAKEAS